MSVSDEQRATWREAATDPLFRVKFAADVVLLLLDALDEAEAEHVRGETRTEWACVYAGEEDHITPAYDETSARAHVRYASGMHWTRTGVPCNPTLMRRTVTTSPWREVE